MTFAQKSKLKKEFMPEYYRTFNLASLIPFFIWLLAGLGVVLALGLTLGEHPATYITIIVWGLGMLVWAIVICVISVKLRNRLLAERTSETEAEFSDMPFAEAEAELTEKKVITEFGFSANRGQFAGQLVVPFKEANVCLHSANIYTKVVTAVVITDLNGNIVAEYLLDKALYNYVLKKGVKVIFNGYSNLIVSDKASFVKNYIVGDSEKKSMTFWFGLLGAYLSDEGKNLNLSKQIVLNVLSQNN